MKKQVTKLLAVVAISVTATAGADPSAHKVREPLANHVDVRPVARPPARPDPWAGAPADPHAPRLPPHLRTTPAASLLALIGISVPRQMPTGAPACGNVASRAPQPIDCGRGSTP